MSKNTITKTVKMWVAVSPKIEGGNIYICDSGNLFETKEDGMNCGWKSNELVRANITYEVNK